ncbi:hypothetical protein DSC45_01850 [Streptomyces sp. YIM 130001]|uniref:hypothetical protein n=1 Tax=Streptomyces sp. YIM 130001 TaxID=2259644 RepID=UPI000EEB3C59|nr:hypothetical protein [Streptomyces sp. YIM 130001]RII20846.1 hypothetical protein DSC45_01850 [Streptomyces sp. YIM 130001]
MPGPTSLGRGKVLGIEGELRRVRFVYFVATIAARGLRQASGQEERWVGEWLRERVRRYGGRW